MGPCRRIGSSRASQQERLAGILLVEIQGERKKIVGAYSAFWEQPITNSRKPTARVKKQPSVEGLMD
jgi:hypothetical protein